MAHLNKLSLIFCISLVGYIKSYYTNINLMNVKCGDTIYVLTAERLKLESYMINGLPIWCDVTFKALNGYNTDILVQASFISMDVACNIGTVEIYQSTDTTRIGPIGSVCGWNPNTQYKSQGQSMVVRFKKHPDLQFYTGSFELLVTMVNNGLCDSDQFMCDNLGCISDLLTCDGYDNCGDDSDESTCFWSPGIITGVSIAVSGVVFVCCLFVIFACRRRNRTSLIYTNGSSGMPYTNGPTIIAQPYYASPPPYQQQYPQAPLAAPNYQQAVNGKK